MTTNVDMSAAEVVPLTLPLDAIAVVKNVRPVDTRCEEFKALVDSIRSRGLQQPIGVRANEDGAFDLVTGHRRYEAWRTLLAEDKPKVDAEIPVHILPPLPKKGASSAIDQLAENMVRQNMSWQEQAMAISEVVKDPDLDMSTRKLAPMIGLSTSHANSLRNAYEQIHPEIWEGLVRLGNQTIVIEGLPPKTTQQFAFDIKSKSHDEQLALWQQFLNPEKARDADGETSEGEGEGEKPVRAQYKIRAREAAKFLDAMKAANAYASKEALILRYLLGSTDAWPFETIEEPEKRNRPGGK